MAAWQAAADPTAPLPTVPQDQLFILLRGFPLTLEHLDHLRGVGLPLHLVLCVNSLVPLAAPAEEKVESTPKKKDQKSRDSKKDPKTKGGKDEKKQEPKKGKDAKGRKGKVDEEDEPPAPTLTLSQQLRAAEAELRGAWVQSQVRDVLLVQHDMKVEQDEPEEEGGPPVLYLAELEDEAAEALYRHMSVIAARRLEYDAWVAGQTVAAVPTLEQTRNVEKLKAELQAKEEEIAKVEDSMRETWELMQTKGGKPEKSGRKPPTETPVAEGKPASRDVKSVKKDKATLEREKEMEAQQTALNALLEERDQLQGQLLAQPPMSPATLEVDKEYYQTLLNSVADPWLTIPVVLHCMVEQVAKTVEAERPVEVLDVAVDVMQNTMGTVATMRSLASDGAEAPLTLRLNANAAGAEAEALGPDVTMALGDYMDTVMARLSGTDAEAVRSLVAFSRCEEDPGEPSAPHADNKADGAVVLDFGDVVSLPHSDAEPLVAGLRVRTIAIQMLEAVAALPRFRKILQPTSPQASSSSGEPQVTTMAGPALAEEDPEVVQLSAEIRSRLTQAQVEREFLLAEFEALLTGTGTRPPPDFENRTLFEPLQRLTLLQRFIHAFEEPELKISLCQRPQQPEAHLCVLHRHVPPCRFAWSRQVAEFTGLTYFPEWLRWYQRLQTEGRLPADDPLPGPVPPSTPAPEAEATAGPTFAEMLLRKEPPPESFANAQQWHQQATLAELAQKLCSGGPRELYRIQASGPINPVLMRETTTLFPADGALVRVTNSYMNSHTVSCTVLHCDVQLGLHCQLPPPEASPVVADVQMAPAMDATVTLRVPELAGNGISEREDFPWGQLRSHGLYITAHFDGGSTLGIQAQMSFPTADAHEAEGTAPTVLTVADYSCNSGLLVTQLSSGELLQTYCAGLAETVVTDDDEDVPLGVALDDDDPLNCPRRSISCAATLFDKEKEMKSTVGKASSKGPPEPPATYQEPLKPEGLPALRDPFKFAIPVNGAFPATEGTGTGLPQVRSVRDSHVLGPLCLVHVWDRLRQLVEPLLACEVRRKVVGRATVIRYLQGGTIQILLADGGTSTYHHGSWLVTHVSGRRTVTARGEVFEASQLLCATNMDAETRAMVTTREDLVMVIRCQDGSRLAQHADGTRIWTAADGASFRIETPRFAPVELHGAGPHPSTLVHLPDGGLLRCVPDREFALLRPDDNYFRVDLQQHLLSFEPPTAGLLPGALEACGVYQCNYVRGGLRTIDREGHSYRVNLRGECATQLADPTAANHPIVDAVDQDLDAELERLWGLPRGTLRGVYHGAPVLWPMATLTTDRLAHPPTPKPAAKLPAPPQAATIIGDVTAGRKATGSPSLHRPRLFLVHADGSAMQLHTAADLLPFMESAVHNAPNTTVEHHPVAGQPGLQAVTVLTRFQPIKERCLHVLDDIVPRSVASVYHRGGHLWQTHGFESLAASHLATLQLSHFLSSVAALVNATPLTAADRSSSLFIKRSFLRYPQLDPAARRALRWAVQNAAAEVKDKASTVAALQARDGRSAADVALQQVVQEQLLALIHQKEEELKAQHSSAQRATMETEPKASDVPVPTKPVKVSKPRANPLAAKKETLQQMQSGSRTNYWQSTEGRQAHAALPAYSPPAAKPRPPPSANPLEDLEREGSISPPISPSGSAALFHTQPVVVAPAPAPPAAGPRTGYTPISTPGGAAAVGHEKPRDVHGRVRESGVPVKVLNSDFAASEPNAAYLQREAGKQRTSKTASTASAAQRASPASPSSLGGLGGSLNGVILDPMPITPQDRLVATPSRLNFGSVCEGYVYGMDFTLTNLGHVPCRFHIKLPKSDALGNAGDVLACDWVKGPIAPGMTIRVSVQLSAATTAGQDINETILVSAESCHIHLPVTATIRPSSESSKLQPSRNVRLLSNTRLPAVKRPSPERNPPVN
eukprot:GGOE01019529.1.p1 GENE.GGOE01019529.1~~GGOE01019529.1.p1  ORF type:complete len:2073 (+),score=655.03 GGOE01019529.1:419-6220(+)